MLTHCSHCCKQGAITEKAERLDAAVQTVCQVKPAGFMAHRKLTNVIKHLLQVYGLCQWFRASLLEQMRLKLLEFVG